MKREGRALPVDGARTGGNRAERPIFAEHGEQAAVIRGQDYLVRSRDPSKAPPKGSAPLDRSALVARSPVVRVGRSEQHHLRFFQAGGEVHRRGIDTQSELAAGDHGGKFHQGEPA